MTVNVNQADEIADNVHVDMRPPMERLPYWARSSNPIVRRHLGLYWRTLPPEIEPILYIVGGWTVLILLGIIAPFVTDLATTVIVVSVLVIPLTMIFYVRSLFSVASNSAAAMSDEIRNNTMHLLMSTPMTIEQILLGKVAASIWRKMDDLLIVVHSAALFGAPLIIMHFAGILGLRDSGVLVYVLIIAMMIVSLLRLVLEPIMFGMIGVTIGAFVPFRSTAKTASVAMVGFYFLLMIMLQQLNLGYAIGAMQAVQEATEATVHVAQTRFMWAMVQTVVVDIVLPLALPYVMTRGLIRIVRHHVESL
jgi:hypothetical protein